MMIKMVKNIQEIMIIFWSKRRRLLMSWQKAADGWQKAAKLWESAFMAERVLGEEYKKRYKEYEQKYWELKESKEIFMFYEFNNKRKTVFDLNHVKGITFDSSDLEVEDINTECLWILTLFVNDKEVSLYYDNGMENIESCKEEFIKCKTDYEFVKNYLLSK